MTPTQQQKQLNSMIEWLYKQDSPAIFTQKEFEKKYPGRQPSQVLRENLDLLVGDSILEMCKCGNINVFYFYKNVKLSRTQKEFERICAAITKYTQDCKLLKEQLESLKKERRDFNGKAKLVEERRLLFKKIPILQKEIKKINSHRWSEDEIKERYLLIEEKKIQLAALADNIEILIDYICKQYNIDSQTLRKEFEIPNEFSIYI